MTYHGMPYVLIVSVLLLIPRASSVQPVAGWGAGACIAAPAVGRTVFRDSAGIRITENHPGNIATLKELSIDSALVLTIGPAARTARADFVAIISALRLSSGAIVVLDGIFNTKVSLFDSAGRFVRSISGVGDGPAEYRSTPLVFRLPADSLILADRSGRKLIYVAPNGSVARTRQLPEFRVPRVLADGDRPASFGSIVPRGMLADGTLIGSVLLPRARNGPGLTVLRDSAAVYRLAANSGDWQKSVDGLALRETFRMSAGAETLTGSPPFPAPNGFAVDRTGFFHGDGKTFEIKHYTALGKVDRIVRLCVAPVSVGRADIQRYRDSVLSSAASPGQRSLRERFLSEVVFPQQRPAYEHFRMDVAGRLWVKTTNPAQAHEHLVFSPDGAIEARALVPRGALEFGPQFALVVRHDAFEVPSLFIHRVR